MASQRHGHDLLALQHPLRYLALDVAKERLQYDQPLVLRSDRAMPLLAQMVEEGLDERHIDVGKHQTLDGDATHIATEPQQQREHVAVGRDGVGPPFSVYAKGTIRMINIFINVLLQRV